LVEEGVLPREEKEGTNYPVFTCVLKSYVPQVPNRFIVAPFIVNTGAVARDMKVDFHHSVSASSYMQKDADWVRADGSGLVHKRVMRALHPLLTDDEIQIFQIGVRSKEETRLPLIMQLSIWAADSRRTDLHLVLDEDALNTKGTFPFLPGTLPPEERASIDVGWHM
jgi:hypothetical protein